MENTPNTSEPANQKPARKLPFISKKIDNLIAKGRIQAIVKEVAGRRMLVGFERTSKRSRFSRIKYFSKPIELSKLNQPDLESEVTIPVLDANPTGNPEPNRLQDGKPPQPEQSAE